MNKLKLLFDNFDILADAPNGIKKMRESILQLAVQGKLTEQWRKENPNVESASELLRKIKAEKEKLIKEKKIKKQKSLPEISEDEIPFEIPDKWEFVRLGSCGDWGSGATPKRGVSEYYNGTTPWFKSGELNNKFITDSEEKVTELAFKESSLRRNKPGDVLIAMYGATIGKTAITQVECATNQAVCACTCFNGVYNVYLLNLLKAYNSFFINQGAGGAQPNISKEKVIATVVPLPPLPEQDEIVKKVDQLMALCNELEKQKEKRDHKRITLNSASLFALTNSQHQTDFITNWQHITANFDALYSTPENIKKLKETILQLAVQGKLTENWRKENPNIEPASELLKKIKAEKEKLIKEKKIKKSKPLPPIIDEEIPFEIPSKWEWRRLGEICKLVEYGTSSKSSIKGDIPVISMGHIKDGKIKINNMKYVSKTITDLPRLLLKTNDILFNRTNSFELVGKSALYTFPDDEYTFASYLIRLKLGSYLEPLLYNHIINSSYFRKTQIEPEIVQQCGQANFNGSKLKNSIVPIPSLLEQQEIVRKVSQLMALCDELESNLTKSQEHSEKLINSILNQAVKV